METKIDYQSEIDGKTFLSQGFNNIEVEVIKYPISDRYCQKGTIGTVSDNSIRVGGAWFDLDERWIVKHTTKKPKIYYVTITNCKRCNSGNPSTAQNCSVCNENLPSY